MSGRTVSIGCKLPNGLIIRFEKFDNESKSYQTINDIELQGANSSKIIGGYGLTDGVDADLFAEWLRMHKDDEIVRLGIVFQQTTPQRAADAAKERAGVKTGFEPIDPDKPGRQIEPADTPFPGRAGRL